MTALPKSRNYNFHMAQASWRIFMGEFTGEETRRRAVDMWWKYCELIIQNAQQSDAGSNERYS